MNEDVKKAFEAIAAKKAGYTDLYNYYDGKQPLVYASERLKEVFAGVEVRFTENWCAVVVDSVKERLALTGLTVKGTSQAMLGRLWEDNQLNLEADLVHEAALITGEGFLIAWLDEEGQIQAYFNDPRLCHAFYLSDNPRVMRCAAKMWVNDAEHYQMTLYYPDRLEYYETENKAVNISTWQALRPMEIDSAPNPYGQIPVFHFRTSQRRIKSDLVDVVPIQNGINKLMSDMMVAAEFGAFRQRYVISNVDINKLRNAPNEIWALPAGDGIGQSTQAGEFTATELDNYLKAIEKLAGDIGQITRTPAHYFFRQGGDPSGEALIAMEAPLNKKVMDRMDYFSPVWKAAGAFMLRLGGETAEVRDITPVWAPVETVQPETKARIRLLETQAGLPLVTVLRREGWSEAALAQLEQDRTVEGAQLGNTLLGQFDKGQ